MTAGTGINWHPCDEYDRRFATRQAYRGHLVDCDGEPLGRAAR